MNMIVSVVTLAAFFLEPEFLYSFNHEGISLWINLQNTHNVLNSNVVHIRDSACRPTFQELLPRLRELQRQYALQVQAARSAAGESAQKEL